LLANALHTPVLYPLLSALENPQHQQQRLQAMPTNWAYKAACFMEKQKKPS